MSVLERLAMAADASTPMAVPSAWTSPGDRPAALLPRPAIWAVLSVATWVGLSAAMSALVSVEVSTSERIEVLPLARLVRLVPRAAT